MATEDFAFDSRFNYQKIFDNDTVTMDGGDVEVIAHSLGYKPNAKVWVNDGSGAYFPAIDNQLTIYQLEFPTNAILDFVGFPSERFCTYQIDDDNLTIKMYGGTAVIVRYRIYLDAAS